MAPSFFTEEDRLGAVSGAADSCELFTEDYRLGAVSGAAGSCGRETGSIKELSLLRAGLFESEVDEIIFGMKTYPAREIGYDSSTDAEPPAVPGSAQPPSSFSCPRS